MCLDKYKQYSKEQSYERAGLDPELAFVFANRVRMDAGQQASAESLRLRLVAALPPLPREPYEIRTTFPSQSTTLREHLLLPYYALLCGVLLFPWPVWLPLSIFEECLKKVGLWPYIEKLFQHLVLSPFSLASRVILRPLRYSYGAVARLSRDCTRVASRIKRYIARSTSRTVALLLLPYRTLLKLVDRTTKFASVVLTPDSRPVECKTASWSHSLGAMGLGKKVVHWIITFTLGFFVVLPLITCAAITFSLAIVVLGLIVLVKGAGHFWLSLKHWWVGDDRNSPEAIARRNRAAAAAKREARSRSESFSQSSTSDVTSRSQSRRSNRSGSNISLPQAPPLMDRDYEGVGGWLLPSDNNDHNTSAIMDNDSITPPSNPTRRLDATPPTAFRRRSFTASSSGINSPEMLNTPSLPRHSTGTALPRQSGSPQSYFNNGAAARSSTSITSRRNSNSRRSSNSRRNSRVARTDGSTDERV